MELFYQKVQLAIKRLSVPFGLTEEESDLCCDYAERIGWQNAKPNSIALALIRIMKPNIPKKTFYTLGNTEYNTLYKWISTCCEILNLNQNIYKKEK